MEIPEYYNDDIVLFTINEQIDDEKLQNAVHTINLTYTNLGGLAQYNRNSLLHGSEIDTLRRLPTNKEISKEREIAITDIKA